MSLQDNLFTEDAEEDLKNFLKNESRKRVLLFPPTNNYRRFLIHQLVQDNFCDLLQTFSIGQGLDRRTVVCFKSDFMRLPQVNDLLSSGDGSVIKKSLYMMGIESQCTPTASPEHNQKSRQIKSIPAVEIYRPPAARRARLEKSPAGLQLTEHMSDACAKANRQKRPDRAVYVPRHRRGAPDADNILVEDAQTKLPKEVLHDSIKPAINIDTSSPIIPKEFSVVQSVIESVWVQSSSNCLAVAPKIENFKNQIIYQDLLVTDQATGKIMGDQLIFKEDMPTTEEMTVEIIEEGVKCDIHMNEIISPLEESEEIKEEIKVMKSLECLESSKRNRRKTTKLVEKESNPEIQTASVPTITELNSLDLICNRESEVQEPKSSLFNLQESSDHPCEEKNKNVFGELIMPKVLIISSSKDETEVHCMKPLTVFPSTTLPEQKVKKVERPKSKPAPPPLPISKINRDEYDWDSLFDDNGDCLDPTLMDELSSAVGEVVIEKPKITCKAYAQTLEVSSDEFAHVLEIYNFPSEFKSSDLAAVFSPFKSEGFELKWVDDTHCLGVFSSPLIAAEVLASDHPFVKTRPLSEATALSKTKARRSSEFLQPYRNRPETCAALARRLVTKSLGVKLATARQEREQEKIVLREAKEKKRLANKQREDVWEGIITEKQIT